MENQQYLELIQVSSGANLVGYVTEQSNLLILTNAANIQRKININDIQGVALGYYEESLRGNLLQHQISMLSLALRIDYQGKIENQLDYFKIVQRMDRQQKRGKRKVKTLEKLLGRK